ncbi:MAG: thiamine phosphate synthase [Kiritimatiellia bacterium]|nr:thiamine phosphate synthase [Lentisphaerota bacterium]
MNHSLSLHAQRLRRLQSAGIYLVTSASLSAGRSTPDIVLAALAGGIRLIQLREKNMGGAEMFRLARTVRRLTREAGALLLINDRLDIALAVRADGVHLGQSDLPVAAARRLAPDMLIGASTHSIAEARRAERAGASYINIGPLFPTRSKDWTGDFLGMAGLRRIAAQARLPYTVMGGIKQQHIPELRRAGVAAIALITAITSAPDPGAAAQNLLRLAQSGPAAPDPGRRSGCKTNILI